MNSFTANLAQELGVPHHGAWLPGVSNDNEAVTALSRLNGCSEDLALQLINSLKPYTNDPGCNGMFYSSVANNSGATTEGDTVNLGNACFIDIQNPENNSWSFADISSDLSAVYCNGLLVGLIGVAPAGVGLESYTQSVVPNIPHQLYGFMGFTVLLAESENGTVDITIGLVDASGADLEWFEFDTVQTAYLVAKGLFLNNGTFGSIYYRAAMFGKIMLAGVTYENNDMIAEVLIKLVDEDASGVVDVTPAVEDEVDIDESPPDENIVLEDSSLLGDAAEDTVETEDTVEADDIVEDLAYDNFDTLPDIPEFSEADFEPLSESVEEEIIEEEIIEEESIEEEIIEEEIIEEVPVEELIEEELLEETYVEEIIEDELFEGDSLDLDAVEEPIEELIEEPIEEPTAEEPEIVSLGREDLVYVLRRVLGASDLLITLIIGEANVVELTSETPVGVDAICHVMADEYYSEATMQSFLLLADPYSVEGMLKCSDAIQAIAKAIWGEIPEYSLETTTNHAAGILYRHRDALWLGVYNTTAVVERLQALGYKEDVCNRVAKLMSDVKTDSYNIIQKLKG